MRPKIERRKRLWCVMDLVTDPVSGKLRETLFWSNMGKGSALGWFGWHCYKGTDTDTLWLIVMAVLTCHAAFSQWIISKAGQQK